MLKLIHITEGLRIFRRSLRVKRKGTKKYKGKAQDICNKIVKDCWNGTYFQTSTGHFCEFWTRDFGWCTEPLIKLRYKDKVKKTLEYALERFSRYNQITTTISPKGIPFDFPDYAPGSLVYLIRSLRLLGSKILVKKYQDFLNSEIHKFHNIVLDKETGLVRKDKHFSSIKDHALRTSSCYDNIMVAMLNNELRKINILDNPLKHYNFKKIIKDTFWTGTHFIDELSGVDLITGDANVFPFWSLVFTSKKMLKSAIETIREYELDKPFPLRYYHEKTNNQEMRSLEILAPNYERNTVWMHMGPLYINLVTTVNKNLAQEYIVQYTDVIEHYKNYLELFNPDGTPFKSRFYYADEGMLWASLFLNIKN